MAGIAKSTTTPAHMTTLYTMGVTKGFHSPHRKPPGKWPNPSADQPHEQCSHPHPPCPRAKRDHSSVSKPDRKTAVPNYSAFSIYWNPSHHPRNSLSNAPPISETRQKQRGHPAHMTSPEIRRAPNKQWPMGNHLVCSLSRVCHSLIVCHWSLACFIIFINLYKYHLFVMDRTSDLKNFHCTFARRNQCIVQCVWLASTIRILFVFGWIIK